MPKSVRMTEVSKLMTRFLELQNEYNIHESFNVVQAKWTLRDIMTQINDPKLSAKLVEFFFIVSEERTWKEFEDEYDNYLEQWKNYVSSVRYREYQNRRTMEQRKNK